ncbi:MAG: hypothetical protein QM528_02850 [Phycisphaerales bacterium]|nr:hypothetical protein [Phycisphaerales bacterium]
MSITFKKSISIDDEIRDDNTKEYDAIMKLECTQAEVINIDGLPIGLSDDDNDFEDLENNIIYCKGFLNRIHSCKKLILSNTCFCEGLLGAINILEDLEELDIRYTNIDRVSNFMDNIQSIKQCKNLKTIICTFYQESESDILAIKDLLQPIELIYKNY